MVYLWWQMSGLLALMPLSLCNQMRCLKRRSLTPAHPLSKQAVTLGVEDSPEKFILVDDIVLHR